VSYDPIRWVQVATLDDLWEGEMAEVEVDGERVLLIHLPGGEICGYQATCPHQRQPLVDGDLEENVLVCARHGWEFDVRTGRGVNPAGSSLLRYEVRREGDRILVGLPGQRAGQAQSPGME
jgi:toluene monooxygenase system ferredoxin subunit